MPPSVRVALQLRAVCEASSLALYQAVVGIEIQIVVAALVVLLVVDM